MLKLTKYEKTLVLLFVVTLPLCNPWVRGDGVGYYAYARAMLIEHRLDFTRDWRSANTSFRMGRVDANGNPTPDQYTVTAHLNNHFAIGPAVLWSPFLIVAHVGVVAFDRIGGHIPADGFSKPYRVAMALGTALCGFLAVLISFALARRYVAQKWAFIASIGIWFGSSLPVYMYFNPSWSHAHAAFAVALFVWYWVRTRDTRTLGQWMILGAIGGLMMDVYYVSAIILLLPLLESLAGYLGVFRRLTDESAGRLFLKNCAFALACMASFLPTLITKRIIYGGYLKFGYTEQWFWSSPAFLKVLFSPDHGLFTWTPILFLSVLGFFILRKYDRSLAHNSIVVFLVYAYVIGCYQDWDGIASFGNRFFVPLTVLFTLGLAACIDWLARAWRERRATVLAWSGTAALVLWNLGLIFQWGMHLIPERGPISWKDAAYNQVVVVPSDAGHTLRTYFLQRKAMMDRIEQIDVKQIKSEQSKGTE